MHILDIFLGVIFFPDIQFANFMLWPSLQKGRSG